MDEPNFIEIQRKHDEGDLTVEQAYRIGITHAAYGWAKHYRGNQEHFSWSQELRMSYEKGYEEYLKK